MKPTLIQKAFAPTAIDMTFGDHLAFDFPVTWSEFTEAVQEVSQYAPLMRGRIRGGQILFADKVHTGKGSAQDHISAPTTIKALDTDRGFTLISSHDLLDGWSLFQIIQAVSDMIEYNKAPTFRSDAAYPRIRSAGSMDLSNLKPFRGVRGQPVAIDIELPPKTVSTEAKKHGLRAQGFLATALGRVLDNPAIITARIPEGYHDCVGHFTQHALGSLDENGFYREDCSFENFTRVIMKYGMSDSQGTAFVGAFPVGDASWHATGRVEFFCANQIGKVQLAMYKDREFLRIFFNQAVPDPQAKAEQIAAIVSGG